MNLTLPKNDTLNNEELLVLKMERLDGVSVLESKIFQTGLLGRPPGVKHRAIMRRSHNKDPIKTPVLEIMKLVLKAKVPTETFLARYLPG